MVARAGNFVTVDFTGYFVVMAKVCDVCAKGPMTGRGYTFLRSHWNSHDKRRWLPNLQPVRAMVAGAVKKMKVCTSCIKAGKIKRAV
ncbi:MAG: 50S ribosomal protein L28 [Candidatus Obscuribacterales bacterium]|nr:50S ribosomal protein L28 [Candidatus Obscuribacterales bacterium]